MVSYSSVARSRRFRELVALSLAVAGFKDAHPRPDKLSEMVGEATDILGVEHVAIRTSAGAFQADDLLREARELASNSDADLIPVAVSWRPSKSASDSFVLLDLRGFATLLKGYAAHQDQQALSAHLEELEDG